jgi:molybdopterin-binding protein
MNVSARNILKGTVTKVVPGTVNTEITIQLGGGTEIVSLITKDSAERLKLATGKTAYALVKASDVMVAVD